MKFFRLYLVGLLVLFLFPQNNFAESVLKDKNGWEIDTIAKGIVWYKFENSYKRIRQSVNVLEVDIRMSDYDLEIVTLGHKDSLSNVAKQANALVAINGTWGVNYSFIKSNNRIIAQPTKADQDPNFINHWKFEGAFFYDNITKDIAVEYGTPESYFASPFPNIITAAPVLIDEFNPVGETFVGDVSNIDLDKLESSDYRRHQGVRHPRTAIGCTEDGRILLITVDGRTDNGIGMNAKEMTQFFQHYFNPRSLLNLDGGGSTAMYIKDHGTPPERGIVNLPIDESIPGKQHLHRSFILIKKSANSSNETVSGSQKNNLQITQSNRSLLLTSDKDIQSVKLYNITGRLVHSKEVFLGQYTTPPFESGVYYLEVAVNHVVTKQKIIIY